MPQDMQTQSWPLDPDRVAVQRSMHESARCEAPESTRGAQPAARGESAAIPIERLGHYRLIRKIGEGGMGVVYEAEQDRPRRRVAVKVIRAGSASGDRLRRFMQEGQILGRLQHPNIAQIYEADVARIVAGEQPYFAMEYVDGRPLLEHARERNLSVPERLALLAQVADAVQHAHTKGVIHRDLKPSNILVTPEGQPKVLDFGVARALDHEEADATRYTMAGQLVGTLPYMSPEQAGGDMAQVDARSDVYALGVIGYEMLTGRLPYVLPPTTLEALRVIREEEPTRITGAARERSGAECEAEWILLKSLEKDPARRYATVSELAADIRRLLSHEPIHAHPPSTWYQIRKLARRHRVLVSGVAATSITLVGAVIGTSYGMIQARRAEALALKREGQLSRVAEYQASMLADIDTKTMGELLAEEMGSSGRREDRSIEPPGALAERPNPVSFNGTDLACRILDQSILRPSVKAIDEQFAGDAVVKATLLSSIGASYQNLSMYDRAEPLLRTALELRTESLGEAHADTLRAKMNFGTLLHIASRPLEAEPLLRSALKGLTRAQGPDDPTRLSALNNLAWNLHEQGHFEEALGMYQEAYQRMSRVFGDADPTTLVALHNLGFVSHCLGRLDDAEGYYRKGLEIIRRQPDNKPSLIDFLNSLGFVLTSKRQFQEADVLLREAIDVAERTIGSDNRETLLARNSLAGSLKEQGRLDEAREVWEDVCRRAKNRLGDHWLTAVFLWEYAGVARRTGKLSEAEAALLDNIGINQRLGPDRRGNPDPSIRELVSFYEEWNRAEPGKGMDMKAAEWTKRQAEPKP